MKISTFIIIAGLFVALSGCDSSSDLLIASTEAPIQVEYPLDPPSSRVVEFADPVIEEAVRELLQKPDGTITEVELLDITVLGDRGGSADSFGNITGEITTLSDLKYLKNRKTLSLGDCGIKSLVGIEELQSLEILRLRRNEISDLEPLCMKSLYAPYSNITDISSLADKVDLEYLQLFHNKIVDISALNNLQKLNYLELGLNEITDISPSEHLKNLEYVGLNDNLVPQECLEAFYMPTKEEMFTREFREKLGDNLPEVIFELLAFQDRSSSRYQTTKITIKNAESGVIIQEIAPSEYTNFNENPSFFDDSLGFVIEDMNFDGYADIRIVEVSSTVPNIPYACWAWDRKSEQYAFHPVLSAVASLEVGHENKIIHNSGRASATEHFEAYYRYFDVS